MKEVLRQYKDYIENILGLVLIFAILIFGFSFFDMSKVQDWVKDAGVFGPIVLILAKASTMIFAPVSGAPLYPLAGALFGFLNGSIYLIVGDFIGSIISFYISRVFGKRAVERFARGNLPLINKILTFMETTKGFLIARICFIAMPEAVSYASGLTRISFKKFIIIQTVIGIIPTLILSGFGSWIAVTSNPWLLGVLIAIGTIVVIFGGFFFMKMTNKKEGELNK